MISTVELVIIDKREFLRLTLDKEDIDFRHLIKITLTIAISDLHIYLVFPQRSFRSNKIF